MFNDSLDCWGISLLLSALIQRSYCPTYAKFFDWLIRHTAHIFLVLFNEIVILGVMSIKIHILTFLLKVYILTLLHPINVVSQRCKMVHDSLMFIISRELNILFSTGYMLFRSVQIHNQFVTFYTCFSHMNKFCSRQ